MTLLSEGQKALGAQKFSKGWGGELYLERSVRRETSWAEGHPDKRRHSDTFSVSARVVGGGRQGLAHGGDLSKTRVLCQKARAFAELTEPVAGRALPSPSQRQKEKPAFTVEPGLFKESAEALLARCQSWEKALLAFDPRVKKVLRLGFEEAQGQWAVVNSQGVAVEQPFGTVSFYLELMGEDKGEVQVAWDSIEHVSWKEVNEGALIERVREKLLRSFGASSLPSGAWPVLVDPNVGTDFLGLLAEASTAEAVQKGRSAWKNKLNQTVASPAVTLVDDGQRVDGVSRAYFDEEGCPTQKTIVVDKGCLRRFLYDTATAGADGAQSTGNASRGGAGAAPRPGPTHFYLEPGAASREALLAQTPKAFWVQEVLGMHTADATSGDFSVGASGVLVEDGKVVRAVKGVTLAGNVFQLLSKVDAVSNDLTWAGGLGSPTFRVSSLSVGGS